MFRRTAPNTLISTKTRRTRMITRLLVLCLWLQAITPPAMARPSGPSPVGTAISNAPGRAGAMARHVMATLGLAEKSLVAFLSATFAPQENWNVVLTPVTAEFKDYAGL